jgi:hypothetical protein
VEPRAFAVAGDDSVIVTGDYSGTVDFGGQWLSCNGAAPGDAFVARYRSDGSLLWVRGLSASADARGLAVTADADRIVVAGMYDGPLDLAGEIFTPTGGDRDAFVAAYDVSGALVWGRAIQGMGAATKVVTNGVASAPNGDVIVAGDFSGMVSFAGAPVAPVAAQRAFVARFGGDGTPRSMRPIGRAAPGSSTATQVAARNGLAAVQTLEWSTAGLPDATGGLHAFDDTGAETWSAQLSDDGGVNPQARAVAVATDSRVMSSAWVDSPFDGAHPDQTTGDMEISAFDSHGTPSVSRLGRRMVGARKETAVRAAAVGPAGTTAFAGDFAGALELGDTMLATPGDADVFVTVVDPQ